MQHIHYHNDFTVPISLVANSITINPDIIGSITFYTRKQGNTYCCCWDCKTLYKEGNCVYAVVNQHNLETGVLKYMIEYQIPDNNYPDKYQKICQHYTSDIELTKENGDITVAEAQIIYGDTIEELLESAGYSYTKEEVDDMIAQLDLDINTYSKDEIDQMIADVDAYTKSETNTLLDGKADSNSVYTKTESDNKYLTAQDISQLANRSEIPTKTSQLQNDSSFISDSRYVHTDNNYTTTEKNKLAALSNYDDTSLSNRISTLESDIDDKADKSSTVSDVSYNIRTNKISKTINGTTSDVISLHSVATTGNYYQLNNRPTIPDKTSDLTNDSNFVEDANYNHTDNNYTTAEKNKLAVLSNYDDTALSSRVSANETAIANTYTKAEVDDLLDDIETGGSGSLPSGVVIDANYVHTDNNYTTVEKTKLANLDGNQRTVIQVFTPNTTATFKDADGNALSESQVATILGDETKEPVLFYNEQYYNVSAKTEDDEYFYYKFTFTETTYNGAIIRTIGIDVYKEDSTIDSSYNSKSIATPITTNVGFGQGYGTQNNSAASSSVTAQINSYAGAIVGGIVVIYFNYDVPANATLNITNKGAKPIYFRNRQITEGVIKAGDTATFMYSTNKYMLICNDRWGLTN